MNRLFAAGLLALAGCTAEPEEEAAAPEAEAGSLPASTAEPIEEEEGSRFASRYTAHDIAGCDLLGRPAGGEGGSWQCEGYNGAQYWLREREGRYDLDAGVRDDGAFRTLPAANELGDTIEWRLRDEKPFAVIFSYRDTSPQGKTRTVLAVETIGTGDRPGCRVTQIAGGTREAHERARALADKRAVDFDCASAAKSATDKAR